jgi:hypothetical protein
MALTKTWTPSTSEQRDQWHRFSLATFMLGSAPGDLYYFTSQRALTVTPFHPYWAHARRLGRPTDVARRMTNGMYRRPYEGGFAMVNPLTTSQSYTVARGFSLLGGQTVGANTRVEMPPYTGQLFIR